MASAVSTKEENIQGVPIFGSRKYITGGASYRDVRVRGRLTLSYFHPVHRYIIRQDGFGIGVRTKVECRWTSDMDKVSIDLALYPFPGSMADIRTWKDPWNCRERC